jgi:methylamine dehydrogenase accessory protein MauD
MTMGTPWLLVSFITLWLIVLVLAFLLLGALRSLALLRWRLDQMEATTPRRVGRDGLKVGARAPDFALLGVDGAEVRLGDFVGRKVFLVFTQSGCGPCHRVMPELNRLQDAGVVQVLVVNNGEPEATRAWGIACRARFPVLVQENYSLSKRYEILAAPFAFLIDERGVIASKGIVNNRQHIGYVLDGNRDATAGHDGRAEAGNEHAGVEAVHPAAVRF